MTRTIRRHDRDHLVTVGIFLVGDQAKNLPLGLSPAELAGEVDYLRSQGRVFIALVRDDPATEIERAAEKQRSRQRKRSPPKDRKPTPEERRLAEKGAARQMLESAMTESDTVLRQILTIAILLAILFGLFWSEAEALGHFLHTAPRRLTRSMPWVFMLFGMIDFALSVLLYAGAEHLVARWRIRQLGRIGHALDVPRYLELLSHKRCSGRLRVGLRFASPWGAEKRGSIPDAIATWAPALSVSWEGDQLLALKSRELKTLLWSLRGTTSSGRDASTRFFTNRPLHDCFLQIVRQVVPKLDATNPVVAITVDIAGEILPWDTDPEDKHRHLG